MENYVLLGIRPISFKNEQGQLIEGTRLYVEYLEEGTVGYHVQDFFVRPEIPLPKQLAVNDHLTLCFNHRGRLCSVSKQV